MLSATLFIFALTHPCFENQLIYISQLIWFANHNVTFWHCPSMNREWNMHLSYSLTPGKQLNYVSTNCCLLFTPHMITWQLGYTINSDFFQCPWPTELSDINSLSNLQISSTRISLFWSGRSALWVVKGLMKTSEQPAYKMLHTN